MAINDPIADMLTRIRNAVMAGQALVAMPSSKIKIEIAKIMKDEGYLEGFEMVEGETQAQKVLRLKIKYVGERRTRRAVISGLGTCKQTGTPYLYKETEHSLGAFRYWRCHPLHAQGCHDRCSRPSIGRGRRDYLQGLVERQEVQVSRIGRLPVDVPAGVQVNVQGSNVHVKGPKGELQRTFSSLIGIALENNQVVVTRNSDNAEERALHGTTRAVIANMVHGVSTGFEVVLEVEGVGYRSEMEGKTLVLHVGYSHPVQDGAACRYFI